MSSITCPNCANVNGADASFCSVCGASLHPESTLPLAMQPHTPLLGGPPYFAPNMLPYTSPSGTEQPPNYARDTPFASFEYAGWGARFGAYLLDGLILLGLYAVLLVVVRVASPGTISDTWDEILEADGAQLAAYRIFGWWIVLTWAISVAWDALWISSRAMGKPGQRVAGFRVTSRAGERLTLLQAVGRAMAKLLYGVPSIGSLAIIASAITIGTTPRRQSVHELIAQTVCIQTFALTARGLGPLAPDDGRVAPTTHAAQPQGRSGPFV